MKLSVLLLITLSAFGWAQEAESGFELRTTVSQDLSLSPRLEADPASGTGVSGGFRGVLYPTWKLSRHWTISGAVQVHSEPYFFYEFSEKGHDIRTDILQANLSYSRFWNNGSFVVRLGQLSTAFGSFLLHYDDVQNPLIDLPMAYGYYGSAVSMAGLTGAQADITLGKADFRAQFVNSSPTNPRSVFDRDQYGNWAGGIGYTIRQGLRVGVSAYRGPYLDRQYPYFFPGEANPKSRPATAYGVDAQWGRGHWNLSGEWQHFQMTYRAIPTFNEHTGYAEAKVVLSPRWYLAGRAGYVRTRFPGRESYELAAGFRPNRFQLVKAEYEVQRGPAIQGLRASTLSVQLVTSFRAISIARDSAIEPRP